METCKGTRKNPHDEIIHESGNCPFCYYIDETNLRIQELEDDVARLEKEE